MEGLKSVGALCECSDWNQAVKVFDAMIESCPHLNSSSAQRQAYLQTLTDSINTFIESCNSSVHFESAYTARMTFIQHNLIHSLYKIHRLCSNFELFTNRILTLLLILSQHQRQHKSHSISVSLSVEILLHNITKSNFNSTLINISINILSSLFLFPPHLQMLHESNPDFLRLLMLPLLQQKSDQLIHRNLSNHDPYDNSKTTETLKLWRDLLGVLGMLLLEGFEDGGVECLRIIVRVVTEEYIELAWTLSVVSCGIRCGIVDKVQVESVLNVFFKLLKSSKVDVMEDEVWTVLWMFECIVKCDPLLLSKETEKYEEVFRILKSCDVVFCERVEFVEALVLGNRNEKKTNKRKLESETWSKNKKEKKSDAQLDDIKQIHSHRESIKGTKFLVEWMKKGKRNTWEGVDRFRDEHGKFLDVLLEYSKLNKVGLD